MSNLISFIGKGTSDIATLGGKGFHLDRMAKLGLRVPQGFTITTNAYKLWKNQASRSLPSILEDEIFNALAELEESTGQYFGSTSTPLLVSVRSGAAISMPGMMDTFLNVGATNEVIEALAQQYNDEFAYELYKTLMAGFLQPKLLNDGFNCSPKDTEKILKREAHKIVPSQLILFNHTGLRYKNLETIESILEQDCRGGLDDPLTYHYFSTLLSKSDIFNGSLAGVRFTGSRVQERREEDIKQGRIELFTEDYVQIHWDQEGSEQIPYSHLNSFDRAIEITPQLALDLADYQARKATRGNLREDTLRIRQSQELNSLPSDPLEQVIASVHAVFKSWDSYRAQEYRAEKNISRFLGTAVTVQQMVFGNHSEQSGTAVIFSSCPKTGKRGITGEYLLKSHGESLVGGQSTPNDINQLKGNLPKIYETLEGVADLLESESGSVQDIEVTWEGSDPESVYFLQTRNAIISAKAQIIRNLRAYHNSEISAEELIKTIDEDQFKELATTHELQVPAGVEPFARGKAPLEGIVHGLIAFDQFNIEDLRDSGSKTPLIYCRENTTTQDIARIRECQGLLTTTGGAYSHAAIVAMSLGKVATVGCDAQITQNHEGHFLLQGHDNKVLGSGENITINGHTGEIYAGIIPSIQVRHSPLIQEVTQIAKEYVKDLPEVFSIQCLEDLFGKEGKDKPNIIKHAVRKKEEEEGREGREEKPVVLYSLNFDCYVASGALSRVEDPQRMLEERAEHIYNTIQEEYGTAPILYSTNMFSLIMYQEGVEFQELRSWFVQGFIKAARKYQNLNNASAPKSNLVNDPNSQSTDSTSKLITFMGTEHELGNIVKWFAKGFVSSQEHSKYLSRIPYDTYETGINCVILRPWEQEEGYLRAAKRHLEYSLENDLEHDSEHIKSEVMTS